MKTRQLFSTPDLAAARTAMEAARMAGVDDGDISLIARADIEMQDIMDITHPVGRRKPVHNPPPSLRRSCMCAMTDGAG
jgi:hypothetical protein